MEDLDTRRGKVVSASIVGGPAFAICPYIANLAIDFAFELDDAQNNDEGKHVPSRP